MFYGMYDPEEVIEASVLNKIASAQMGSPVVFTPEEIAYLVDLGAEAVGLGKIAAKAKAKSKKKRKRKANKGFLENLWGGIKKDYRTLKKGWGGLKEWGKKNKRVAIPLAVLGGVTTGLAGYGGYHLMHNMFGED
jgi:hypothetical protein